MEVIEAILETGSVAAVEIAASALAERGAAPAPCPNCSKPMIGAYCGVCGQPRNTHRRSLKHLLQEFVKDIVSFDSRILRTTAALLVRPGELPCAFREGRTQRYVPPVRLYLFVSLLFFLFLAATGLALIQFRLHVDTEVFNHDRAGHVTRTVNGKTTIVKGLRSDAKGKVIVSGPIAGGMIEVSDIVADGHTTTNTISSNIVLFRKAGVANTVSPEVRKVLDEIKNDAAKNNDGESWFMRGLYRTLAQLQTDPGALNGPLTTWIPRILFVLLPLFAVLLSAFYIRRRREFFFVDHLVFSLTMHSFVFVVLIGAAVAAQVLDGGLVAIGVWLALSAYFLLSLKRFYGQGWFLTSLKSAGIAFVYLFFFLSPALVAALVAGVVAGA